METITLTVDTTVDENDGGESGTGLSLRDAIAITNETPENEYTIELEGGSTYNLEIDSEDPKDNHLDIFSNVTIRANGDERAIIDASGLTEADIVLHIYGDGNVNLENLTFTGGRAEGEGITLGGGIYINESPTVKITDSLITGNTASNKGSGIFADLGSSVILIDSQITNNQSGDSGGGLVVNGAEANIYSSTISENVSGFAGGGIGIDGNSEFEPVVRVVNSTISGNTSNNGGGGINLDSFPTSSENVNVQISNSTIVNNIAGGDGGGIKTRQSDSIAVENSIIAGNFASGGDLPSDVFGLVIASPTNDNPSNTVYRFLNPDAGVHFYTANETERDAVLELPNYSFEGESYVGADPLSGMSAQPVYRFLNQDTGVHLYTISETERESVAELDNFTFEGEVFSAYETEVESSIPIFRFLNAVTRAHFYTPSAIERDAVEDLPDFQFEGIAYYALPVIDS